MPELGPELWRSLAQGVRLVFSDAVVADWQCVAAHLPFSVLPEPLKALNACSGGSCGPLGCTPSKRWNLGEDGRCL